MRFVFLFLLLWTLTMHAEPFLPPDIVHASADRVHRDGQAFFEIHASGFVQASPQHAWSVLTDYDRLAEFVPDLLYSRLLSRDGTRAVVEQRSQAGLLFLTHTIHIVVRVTEQPTSAIDVALVSGNMKRYRAHWELAPATESGVAGTRITYDGVMEPDFFIPALIGESLVQTNVKRMVEAVIAEINRRH